MKFLAELKTKICDFLENNSNASSASVQSLQAIAKEMADLPQEQSQHLAAYAFLLHRVAYADQNVSASESDGIQKILQNLGGLTAEHAKIVATVAKEQHNVFSGIDDYRVSKEFSQMASVQQRYELMRSLFAVAASDGSISNEESDVVRMISNELNLSHKEFIALRSEYKEHLAALKDWWWKM